VIQHGTREAHADAIGFRAIQQLVAVSGYLHAFSMPQSSLGITAAP
jgi:hypothetical protein